MCVGVVNGSEVSLLATDDMLAILTPSALPALVDTVELLDAETCALAPPWTLLTPLVAPETWGASVTYERSRDARVHESSIPDVYDLVYDAERPELFLRDAGGGRTVRPGHPICVRSDSSWTVPEPELAIVLDADGAAVAATIANDVSARDIEGANPSLPASGEDLRRLLRARTGAGRPRRLGRAIRARADNCRSLW